MKPFDRSFLFQIVFGDLWVSRSTRATIRYFSFFFLTKVSSLPVQSFSTSGNVLIREPKQVACENRCFCSLIAPSGGERGETAVFAGYKPSNHGTNLEWHDVRFVFVFFLHDSKTCKTCVGSQSSKSYTFDSSGANLTPYNGVIFWGELF